MEINRGYLEARVKDYENLVACRKKEAQAVDEQLYTAEMTLENYQKQLAKTNLGLA